jgi:hypothetical protein
LAAPLVRGAITRCGIVGVRGAAWPVLVFHGAATYYYLLQEFASDPHQPRFRSGRAGLLALCCGFRR